MRIPPSMARVQQRITELQTQVAGLGPAGVPGPGATATGAAASPGRTAAVSSASRSTSPYGAASALAPGGLAPVPRTFGDVLATKMAPGAVSTSASRYRPVSISGELSQYQNGKLPPGVLSPIDHGSHALFGPAAGAFKDLTAAAAADGVKIKVTDSYRSYALQVDVARRKGLYSEGGLAAKPGTSKHGWGLAVDLNLDSKAQAWMRANAKTFGFVEDTPREPWHWAYHGVKG